jgi:molybdenum cofactor cytidylyltransferase
MSDPKSALILLAAGNSSRMGAPKQLLDFHGAPLIRRAAETALIAACHPVVVVLGAREREIRPALDGLNVEIAVNDRWSDGMGSSIHCGLAALRGREVAGAILALADQPFVTPDYLSLLVASHVETGRAIVASRYSGTVGVPVFFSRCAFPLLESLGPREGCKGVILGAPDALLLDCPDAAIDIDTPADYARAVAG